MRFYYHSVFQLRAFFSWGCLLWLSLSTALVSAQVSFYTFSQTTEPYADITSGTVLGTASNNFNLAFIDPEVPEGAQNPIGPGFNIGFPFIYRGIVYDRFGVSNNGWICLGRSQYQDIYGYAVRMHAITTTPLNFPASFDTLRSCIAAFAGYITGNGSTTDLRFELLGSAPERTLVIQWKNYRVGPIIQSGASSINTQIRINEIDNSVDIRYGTCSFVNVEGLYTIQVGLGGLTVSEFSNRSTPSNWNATTSGTMPGSSCPAYVVYPPPSSGTNFHWDPPSCVPPANLTISGLGFDSLAFSWEEPYTNPMEGYEYALTSSQSPPMAGSTTFSSEISFQSLSEGTLYYFHIRTLCDMEDQSAWFTVPARTLCAPSVPPYLETFDNVMAPEIPGCLRIENENSYSDTWELLTYPYTVISPPNAAGLNDPFAITRDWLFLPALELSSDTTYINKMDISSYQEDSLVICLGDFPSADHMMPFDTLAAGSPYTHNYAVFTPDSTGTYYIGYKSLRSSISFLDNIDVRAYDCWTPDSIQVVTNQPGMVTFQWNAPEPGALSYEYVVAQYFSYPYQGTILTEDTTITITDLDPSQVYYLIIRSSCGDGNYSPWTLVEFVTVSANDDCAMAIELFPSLMEYCEQSTEGSTIGASASGQAVGTCGGQPDDDVWYKFVAAGRSHSIQLTPNCSQNNKLSSDPAQFTFQDCEAYTMELYSDSCDGAFIDCISLPAGSYGTQFVETDLSIGKTYFIRVFGTEIFEGGSNFNICISSFPPPVNDSCAGAEIITSNETFCSSLAYGNLAAATPSPSPASQCQGAPYYDLWYKFEIIDTIQIIDVSFGNEADGVVEVFSGTSCGALTAMACSDVSTMGPEVLVLDSLAIGDSLWIRIFDATGAGVNCNFEICVRTPNANEFCSGAEQVLTVSGILMVDRIEANTLSAFGSGGCTPFYADDDLWYRFVADHERHLVAVLPESYPGIVEPVIEFFTTSCDSSSMFCAVDGELLLDSLLIGEEYYFRVYSADSLEGKGGFALSVVAPPNNIFCFSPDTLLVNDSSECVLVNECSNVGAGLDNTVWFTFEAQQPTQLIHLDNYNTFFGYMALFDSCDSLAYLAYSSNEYLVAQDLVPGHQYVLSVSGWFSLSSKFFIQSPFSICILAPAINDECSGAIDVIPGGMCDSLTPCSTLSATSSNDSGDCYPGSSDIWYKFVATSTFHKIQVYADDGFYLPRGELFADSCGGQSLICFQYTYDFYYATSNFYDLTIGHTYYLRLMISGGPTDRGTFSFCLSTPPINDECSNPMEMSTPLFSKCYNPIQGTTINSTHVSGDQNNVWYSFTSLNSSIGIKVTPQTIGFDPGIRFWQRSVDGGNDDQYCVLTGFQYQPINIDDTHADGQPEVLVIGGMTPFKEYLIEVYDSDESQQSGDFEFCLFNPGNGFQVYSAEYETYDMVDDVPAGGWHQAVCKIILNVSGGVNMPHLTNATVNTIGSTDPNDIQAVSLVYPPITSFLSSTIPFKPFGTPGTGLGAYLPPIQLGQSSNVPTGQISFAGDIQLIGFTQTSNTPTKRNYKEYLYLVYDVNCYADSGNVLKGACTSLIFDEDNEFIPFEKYNPGLPVIPRNSYETKQDGAWENGSTWMCGEPPPDGYDNDQTNINHHVILSDTAVSGDLKINYLKSLSLDTGSMLTLGRSSLGSQTGYSNKILDCENGSLYLDDAKLNVNGRVYIGNNDFSNIGTFSAINSVLTLDGNDGTLAGSANYLPLLIGTSNFISDNFRINILDPSYQGSFSDFIYNPNISSPRSMSGTLRLGGGDDTGDAYGFIIQSFSNYGGFLIIDSIVVDGGLKANHRAVHSGGNFLACKHLLVSEGAEFVGRAAIQGNLINNGIVTVPPNYFLSFGGNVDIVRHFTNTSNGQSIAGSGFFRSSLSDPIPTSQLDNEISNLYVANTAGGLNMELPLGISNVLRIRQGKINTSDSTVLTLGNETTTGALATDPFEPNIILYQLFSGNVSTWSGGFINGPMRRWFNGTPTSEKSIMPVGYGYTLRPISFQFANTPNGFLDVKYINAFPGNEGMPLVDEQDTTLTSASFGYWRVNATNVAGSYTASVNATGTTFDGFVPITDLGGVRLIKRPSAGAWVNTGSTTTIPPASLSLVKAEGLSGFSDFALGAQYCKVVTNGNDDGTGSLRFAIEQCSNPNDYIYIADFVDSIFLVSDTIILDKDLFIFHTGIEKVVIQTTSSSPVFKTNPGIQITLYNAEIHSGTVASSKALLNAGNTVLWNVDIINTIPGEIPVMNAGTLEISETVQIKNQ